MGLVGPDDAWHDRLLGGSDLRDRVAPAERRSDDFGAQLHPEPPEQILKRRLAEGQISVEEYERLTEAMQDRPRDLVTTADHAPDGLLVFDASSAVGDVGQQGLVRPRHV
jgi:hypothetical protein